VLVGQPAQGAAGGPIRAHRRTRRPAAAAGQRRCRPCGGRSPPNRRSWGPWRCSSACTNDEAHRPSPVSTSPERSPSWSRRADPDGRLLRAVGQGQAVFRSVARPRLDARRVLRGADDEDVAGAGEHQQRQRVVDHRLVAHRQLLADGAGQRAQARAGDAREEAPVLAGPSASSSPPCRVSFPRHLPERGSAPALAAPPRCPARTGRRPVGGARPSSRPQVAAELLPL